jgi:hypothetical protein
MKAWGHVVIIYNYFACFACLNYINVFDEG